MKKIFLLCLFLVGSSPGFSQTGDYYMSHFIPGADADPSSSFDMVQHPNGIVSFANRGGILQFDGKSWNIYPSQGTPVSMAGAEEGVYVVGVLGIGYYPYNNIRDFSIIYNDSLSTDFLQVEVIGDKLYAISSDRLYVLSTRTNELIHDLKLDFSYFLKILNIGDKPLFVTSLGNYWLKDNKLSYAEDVPEKKLSFATVQDKKLIIGSLDGGIYIKENSKWERVTIDKGKFEDKLNESVFIDGISFNGRFLAIPTISEGLILMDMRAKKVEKVIDQNHGLPDNEIFFVSVDSKNGVWVGHAYGVSRIDFSLPYEVYNNFPGLEGNLQVANSHNGNIYVGTTTGLYQLTEVKSYDEKVYYIKKEQSKQDSKTTDNKIKSSGLLAFLKKKSDTGTIEEESEEEGQPIVERRVERQIKSIQYVYKKRDSVQGKVLQILEAENGIFVVTLHGVYYLHDDEVDLITHEPIKLAWLDKTSSFLIANTYDGHLLTFVNNSNKWEQTYHFAGYQDFIFDIFQDSKGRIWFASANEIYWIEYRNGELFAGDEVRFRNPYLHPTYITQNAEGEVLVKNNDGIWAYEESSKELIRKLELPEKTKFLKSSQQLWEYRNDKWINSDKKDYYWLNAFKMVKSIDRDEENNLFIITDTNQLLRIPPDKPKAGKEINYPIVIKSIRDAGEEVDPGPRLIFVQKQSELAFEAVQPEYSGVIGVKYQYRIKGLNDNWSNWSENNNSVYLPYLPEGEYELEMRSKNDFGIEQSFSSLPFEVVPPYWKRPWFYAFEFLVFALLLVITIILNHNSSRYRLLNKLLAFLTLILIIEFIQVSAESNFATDLSPVLAFFIQVTIAFIVLPVEGFLRSLIIKDRELPFMKYLGFKKSKA